MSQARKTDFMHSSKHGRPTALQTQNRLTEYLAFTNTLIDLIQQKLRVSL